MDNMPMLVLKMQRTNLQRRLTHQCKRLLIAQVDESAWLRTSFEPVDIMKSEILKTIKALRDIKQLSLIHI